MPPVPTGEPAQPPREPAEPDHLALAEEFPAATRDQWRALVTTVLTRSGTPEGTDPEAALTRTTYDGIAVAPLYTSADAPDPAAAGVPGRAPFVRGATAEGATAQGWDVRVRHAGADAGAVKRAVLGDLENGATSIWLRVGADGLAVDDLPAALDGVYLDLAPVVLDAGTHAREALAALLRLADERGVAAADLRAGAGADPVAEYARTGVEPDFGLLAQLQDDVAGHPHVRVAAVDATVYHDAGASDAQEIGLATSAGVACLRALTDAGASVDEALDRLEFRFAVTAEQFPSIAKLRAARRVWDRVAELSGAGTQRAGQSQHAVTSAAMLTRRDPWVNMLRTTVACFAAVVGGAEAVTVAPFDSAIGVSDDFARRIARNTQSILHDESSLARVVDAAGGSWYVESLTDALAEAAWSVFTDVESRGGVVAGLADGSVAEAIAGVRRDRDGDVAHRRAPITGVSEFAFVGEEPVTREPVAVRSAEGALLPTIRYAQDFEDLRDRADAASERPRVFLAGLGSLAAASARSGFAANLLQAGGVECVSAAGSLEHLVEEFREAKTPVACLCSSDKVYADQAAPAAAALREAGATQVWLAGKAETDGVDGYLHVGADALEILRTVFAQLGVQA